MTRSPNRRTNDRIATGIATTKPDAASWIVFDALPARVRRTLWGSPVPINPVSAHELVELGGTDYAVEQLQNAVRVEVRAFAEDYARKHGPLPHIAARVSVMRY